MKLYTKEMFLLAAAKCEVCVTDIEHILKYIDEYVDAIEFPSDNDIFNKAREYENYKDKMDELQAEKASSRFHGFVEGAFYVKTLNRLK